MDLVFNVPKYREVNPSYFSMVFFPFMFGLMFGDVFHGALLFFSALLLFFFKTKALGQLIQIRWLLLMMGVFSLYCGLIYNDFLSLPVPLTESCYVLKDHKYEKKCTYEFGMDWVWKRAANENSFVNSFKMKFSIIFGVTHMALGILMKGVNCLLEKKFSKLIAVAIPELVFLLASFGYMCFCIVYKWLQNYDADPENSPSIISLFINFLWVDQPLYPRQ